MYEGVGEHGVVAASIYIALGEPKVVVQEASLELKRRRDDINLVKTFNVVESEVSAGTSDNNGNNDAASGSPRPGIVASFLVLLASFWVLLRGIQVLLLLSARLITWY